MVLLKFVAHKGAYASFVFIFLYWYISYLRVPITFTLDR